MLDISSSGVCVDKGAMDRPIEISSYNPLPFEMNIFPIMAKLLQSSRFKLNHSLPIATQKDEPLVFREYKWGDDLVKSRLFSVYEPTSNKK